jgi:peptidoglycan hydrolase-like protein with peptidoglycan-binding domain
MRKHRFVLILSIMLLLLTTLAFTATLSPQAFAAPLHVQSAQALHSPNVSCPPEIGYGSTGKWVTFAQQGLNNHYAAFNFSNYPYNFYPRSRGQALVVDGIFGILTENATKDFQYAYHLSVDGIIGPHTWHAIGWC